MVFRADDPSLHQGADGLPQPFGVTHRIYKITGAGDDVSIQVPPGTKFMAILQPVEALVYEVYGTARPAGADGLIGLPIAAAAEKPARPVSPGEFINVSHSDGTTAVGVFYLMLEGKNLPNDAELAALITDPG